LSAMVQKFSSLERAADVPCLPAVGNFAEVDQRFLGLLANASQQRIVIPDEVLINAGDHDDTCFLLVRGKVEVLKEGPPGKKPFRRILEGPDLFGEVCALGLRKVRAATVKAITVCDIRTLPGKALRVLILHFQRDHIHLQKNANARLEEVTLFGRLSNAQGITARRQTSKYISRTATIEDSTTDPSQASSKQVSRRTSQASADSVNCETPRRVSCVTNGPTPIHPATDSRRASLWCRSGGRGPTLDVHQENVAVPEVVSANEGRVKAAVIQTPPCTTECHQIRGQGSDWAYHRERLHNQAPTLPAPRFKLSPDPSPYSEYEGSSNGGGLDSAIRTSCSRRPPSAQKHRHHHGSKKQEAVAAYGTSQHNAKQPIKDAYVLTGPVAANSHRWAVKGLQGAAEGQLNLRLPTDSSSPADASEKLPEVSLRERHRCTRAPVTPHAAWDAAVDSSTTTQSLSPQRPNGKKRGSWHRRNRQHQLELNGHLRQRSHDTNISFASTPASGLSSASVSPSPSRRDLSKGSASAASVSSSRDSSPESSHSGHSPDVDSDHSPQRPASAAPRVARPRLGRGARECFQKSLCENVSICYPSALPTKETFAQHKVPRPVSPETLARRGNPESGASPQDGSFPQDTEVEYERQDEEEDEEDERTDILDNLFALRLEAERGLSAAAELGATTR